MPDEAPWVVFANFAQFGAGQSIRYPSVRSRMLLWCKAGHGRVTVNGDAADFLPGDILLAPWKHEISYQAATREPFFLAGIHLIPRQSPHTPYVPDVAHIPGAFPMLEQRRFDTPWPGLEGLKRGHLADDEPLQALFDFIVRRFQAERPDAVMARAMGGLLLPELTRFFARPTQSRQRLAIDFQRALQFIDDHLADALYLDEAARVANHSLSWLHRQFRDSLRTTPAQYMIDRRIRRARQLLSSTSLNVGEVGQRVGIADPYYFSKLFKRQTGLSPREFRKRASLF